MLKPIHDAILFTFVDPIKGIMFVEQTVSGIFLGQSHTKTSQTARWAKVLAVGPEVDNCDAGDTILIEPLMWTHGFNFQDVKIWKTDASKILAVMEA